MTIRQPPLFVTLMWLLIMLLTAGPASAATTGTPGETPFCSITQNLADYEGKTVTTSANYESDGAHNEFLRSTSCGGKDGLIDIGHHGSSLSTKAFYAERKMRCEDRKQVFLCTTDASVTVTGTIHVMNGVYVFDIAEVHHAEFMTNPPPPKTHREHR